MYIFLLKESFQSHVEHKIGTKTVYVIQQHQIVLLFKPYETEFSSMFNEWMLHVYYVP